MSHARSGLLVVCLMLIASACSTAGGATGSSGDAGTWNPGWDGGPSPCEGPISDDCLESPCLSLSEASACGSGLSKYGHGFTEQPCEGYYASTGPTVDTPQATSLYSAYTGELLAVVYRSPYPTCRFGPPMFTIPIACFSAPQVVCLSNPVLLDAGASGDGGGSD